MQECRPQFSSGALCFLTIDVTLGDDGQWTIHVSMNQFVDTIDTELSSLINSTTANLSFGGRVILAMLPESRAENRFKFVFYAADDRWRRME